MPIIEYNFEIPEKTEGVDGKEGSKLTKQEMEVLKNEYIEGINKFIGKRQNPIHILIKKIKEADSFEVMQQVSKAIRNLSQAEVVIHTLMETNDLMDIFKKRFVQADPFS